MKGFPNQISDIQKLTEVLLAFHELVVAGKNIHDEAVVGEALVRKELIGGRGKMSPEEYLKSQLKKTRSNQSYRATARGLNELFRILGLVEGDGVSNLTTLGTSIVEAAKSRSREEIIAFWKPAIHTLGHRDKDGFQSHPYQVLLRLVANHPGINRKMCALALEAKDDSETELQRILKLSHLDEEAAYKAIGVSKSNWNNAKKLLPSFAEQLGDVTKVGGAFFLAKDALGLNSALNPVPNANPNTPSGLSRKARQVTPETIAMAGTVEAFDETVGGEAPPTPEQLLARKKKQAARLGRHNRIVKLIAKVCFAHGGTIYEIPFDCLSSFKSFAFLIEVKSLDGTKDDEIARVREALSQLLYYEAFVTDAYAGKKRVIKIAVFESKITEAHEKWLRDRDIHTLHLKGEKVIVGANADSRMKKVFS